MLVPEVVALPLTFRVLPLPVKVMLLMLELLPVKADRTDPEIVEVAIVDVEIVELVIELLPTKEVLPPTKDKVLLFNVSVPLP